MEGATLRKRLINTDQDQVENSYLMRVTESSNNDRLLENPENKTHVFHQSKYSDSES